MLALLIILVPVLAGLLWAGVRLMMAGRELDDATTHGATPVPLAPAGGVAAKVDQRLQQTRAAVENLVMPEVEQDDLQPSADAFRYRAQTYLVLGAGLLGLAAAMLIGALLLL